MAGYDLFVSSLPESPTNRSFPTALVSDHVLMSMFIFCLAMAYVGFHGASHQTLERSQELRNERQMLQQDIQRTQYLISLNTSSIVVERWAFHAGFATDPRLAFRGPEQADGLPVVSPAPTRRDGVATASLLSRDRTNH